MTDPDSKLIKAYEGYVQGYNAQAVVDRGADRARGGDHQQLRRLVTARADGRRHAGRARAGRVVSSRIETALADAQYWNEQHMDEVIANQHVQVLIPPDGGASGKQRTGWTGGRYTWMRYVLKRTRRAALPKTQTDRRARIRSHQTQPRCHTISPTRPHSGAHRVAITDDDPQPHQAPPSPDRHRRALTGPRKATSGLTLQSIGQPRRDPLPRRPRLESSRPFARRPLAIAAVLTGLVL